MKLIYTDDLIAFLRSPTAKFPSAIMFSVLHLYMRYPLKRGTRITHSKASLVSLCEPACCSPAMLPVVLVLARLWWLRGAVAESRPDARR